VKTPILIAGLLASLSIGCGKSPEAEFVLQPETKDLMREARDGFKNEEGEKVPGVKDYLKDLFGTPNELVAWDRLPIDFGGIKGVTAEQEEADRVRRIKVMFEGDSPKFKAGERFSLVWTNGNQAYGPAWNCAGFDAETNEIIVDDLSNPDAESAGQLPTPPLEGISFVIEPGRNLKSGRKLYMTHCMHCHGVSGDGNGPTAKYLNPLPRDYRKGIFKFTSTNKDTFKSHQNDLERVIRYGIPGTYMPSFLLLEDAELHDIVEYVRWLAMRGEMERAMSISLLGEYSDSKAAMKQLEGQAQDADGNIDQAALQEALAERAERLKQYLAGSEDEGNFSEDLAGEAEFLVDGWNAADSQDNVLIPSVARTAMTKESIDAGKLLFLGKANCANCHGIAGLGNGPQTLEISEESKKLGRGPGLYDTWGHPLQPRNLTTGIYRGGRRPLDVFRRIRAGVKGAVMPAAAADIKDEQVWDIVNYVMSIPLDSEDVEEAIAEDAADNADEKEQTRTDTDLVPVDTVAK